MATTTGGLFVPVAANTSEADVQEAEVIAVGEGEILYNGHVRCLSLRVGDVVLVRASEVLPLVPPTDPTAPIDGIISERNVLCVLR